MDHIQNPLTGENVSIYSNEAKKLIKEYIKLIQSGGKREGKKGKGRVLKKQDPNSNLLILLKFIKNMMSNPNKSEFEEYMTSNPNESESEEYMMSNPNKSESEEYMKKPLKLKVHPDFLNYFKEHINGIIEGPGLEKFILFILFHLRKHLKKPQTGGSGVGSDDTTKEGEGQIVLFKEGEEVEGEEEEGGAIVEYEEQGGEEEEGGGEEVDKYTGYERPTVTRRFKFLWFTIFIGLTGSIYKTTKDFLNNELDLKTPIFEALAQASSENMPDNLKTLYELGEIIKEEDKNNNIAGNLDLISFSTSTLTDGPFSNELIIYEAIPEGSPEGSQEGSQDANSENEKITIYGKEYEFHDLTKGYTEIGNQNPITIGTIASAVYSGNPSMLVDLYTTGTVVLGEVSNKIQEEATRKLSEIPGKLIAKAGDRLLNPNDPITLRAARFFSFTKSSYALGLASSISFKELSRKREDIQRYTLRYIEDVQTAVTRAIEDEIEGFTRDTISYIHLLRALYGSLGTLFLFPLYKKWIKEKEEDQQGSSVKKLENGNSGSTDDLADIPVL